MDVNLSYIWCNTFIVDCPGFKWTNKLMNEKSRYELMTAATDRMQQISPQQKGLMTRRGLADKCRMLLWTKNSVFFSTAVYTCLSLDKNKLGLRCSRTQKQPWIASWSKNWQHTHTHTLSSSSLVMKEFVWSGKNTLQPVTFRQWWRVTKYLLKNWIHSVLFFLSCRFIFNMQIRWAAETNVVQCYRFN